MATLTLAPVRVVTTLRTGSCPDGYVTQDRTLRPLTRNERKAGKRDELKEWYGTYGCVRPCRRQHRRQPEKMRSPRQEPIPNNPPKDVQEEVYAEIRSHLRLVALDLARGQFISYSDIADMEHELFRSAIDELPKWDPSKASRKTYLYEVTALNKIDAVRSLNAKKRQGDYTRLSITGGPAVEKADGCEGNEPQGQFVSEESIADRTRTIERFEFLLDFYTFMAMLEDDERLALDYLLADFTQEEIAKMMGIHRCTWRRTILESLQMKAAFCGFAPHRRRGVRVS